MGSQREEGNGHRYIKINGFKGIWTADEIVSLLQAIGIKIKITFDLSKDFIIEEKEDAMAKEDDRDSEREEASNLAIEKEVR